jgi:hypothetical protein
MTQEEDSFVETTASDYIICTQYGEEEIHGRQLRLLAMRGRT